MKEAIMIILACAVIAVTGLTLAKSFRKPSPRDEWFFDLINHHLK